MNNKESNNTNRQSNPIVSSGFIIFVIAALLIDGAVLFFTSQDGEADDYTEEISEYISNTEVQDEIEEDVPTDVVEEKTYDEAFYTITPNGVANIFIGNTFNDYNTSLMKEEDIAKQWFDFSLVDIKEDNSYDMQTYYMFMKIYEENKLMLALYGGYFDERPNTLQTEVKGIMVSSIQFKLPNGIHTGMSAKELINNYGATIQLHEDEGGEHIDFITFEIPDYVGFTFVADKEVLVNRYGESYFDMYDSQGYKENFSENIKKEVVEYSTLKSILIGDYPIEFSNIN